MVAPIVVAFGSKAAGVALSYVTKETVQSLGEWDNTLDSEHSESINHGFVQVIIPPALASEVPIAPSCVSCQEKLLVEARGRLENLSDARTFGQLNSKLIEQGWIACPTLEIEKNKIFVRDKKGIIIHGQTQSTCFADAFKNLINDSDIHKLTKIGHLQEQAGLEVRREAAKVESPSTDEAGPPEYAEIGAIMEDQILAQVQGLRSIFFKGERHYKTEEELGICIIPDSSNSYQLKIWHIKCRSAGQAVRTTAFTKAKGSMNVEYQCRSYQLPMCIKTLTAPAAVKPPKTGLGRILAGAATGAGAGAVVSGPIWPVGLVAGAVAGGFMATSKARKERKLLAKAEAPRQVLK